MYSYLYLISGLGLYLQCFACLQILPCDFHLNLDKHFPAQFVSRSKHVSKSFVYQRNIIQDL